MLLSLLLPFQKNQVSASYITLPIFFGFIEIIIIFDFYDTIFASENTLLARECFLRKIIL
jgi:hypothetical protein